jgi:ATP-dependent helicase/nuclease subunit A
MEAVSALSKKPASRAKQLPPLKSDIYLESEEHKIDQSREELPAETSSALSREELKKAFGTLCHRVIAQVLLKQDAGIFVSFADDRFKEALFKEVHTVFRKADLSQDAVHTLAEEALDLAKRFLESPLGQEVAASARKQVEFPFILPVKGAGQDKPLLIRGFIDLIYKYKDECVILDFKTDRYLNPHAHQVQVACYRAAAKAFSNLPVRTILVYLRTMEAVPFDPEIPVDKLFELAQSCSQ